MITSNTSPKIALIGCGAIAEAFYLPAISSRPNLRKNLVLVDPNRDRRQMLASRFDITHQAASHTDIAHEINGAIIATPHHLHYPITVDLLSNNIHVLCEKPLAESSEEAREMITLAEHAGVTLSVNLTRRLFPSYQRIKEIIKCHKIGGLVSISYVEGSEFSWPTSSGFYFQTNSPRGILFDKGAHVLDALCWWTGGKPEVLSSYNDSFGGPECVVDLNLQYANCSLNVRLSWLSKLENGFSIIGELGEITSGIEDWNTVKIRYYNGQTETMRLRAREKTYNDFANSLLSNFIDVINETDVPSIPAREVLPSISLIQECYDAARRFEMLWIQTRGVDRAG